MNRRHALLTLSATALAAGAAVASALPWKFAVKAQRQSLLVAGSSTMFALNQALAEEFSKRHASIDIVVEKGGSLPGLIALKRGAIDVAAMTRDLTVAEDDSRIRNFLIAKNNIAIVVNKRSPIVSLSREQVRALFAGDAVNWKQVGGPDAPVTVISRTQGSVSRQFVEDVVLDGGDITLNAKEMPNARQLAERVAADPFAIGYVAVKDSEDLAELSYLAVDGVTASRATILSGRYPYTNALYLVLQGDKQGPAADFVAFARSPQGQKIVEQQHLVPTC